MCSRQRRGLASCHSPGHLGEGSPERWLLPVGLGSAAPPALSRTVFPRAASRRCSLLHSCPESEDISLPWHAAQVHLRLLGGGLFGYLSLRVPGLSSNVWRGRGSPPTAAGFQPAESSSQFRPWPPGGSVTFHRLRAPISDSPVPLPSPHPWLPSEASREPVVTCS